MMATGRKMTPAISRKDLAAMHRMIEQAATTVNSSMNKSKAAGMPTPLIDEDVSSGMEISWSPLLRSTPRTRPVTWPAMLLAWISTYRPDMASVQEKTAWNTTPSMSPNLPLTAFQVMDTAAQIRVT